MNKTYNKWLKRVKDIKTPWTENDIIYFRKAVGSSGLLDRDLRQSLIYDVDNIHKGNGYKITQEQTNKGIAYLLNTVFKANGTRRNSEKSKVFGEREVSIMKNFKEFRFMGLYRASDNNIDFFTPIYRVVSKDNRWFEYTTNMGVMTLIS